MRKMVITLLALGVFAASAALAANPVRISQVYTGGGSTSAYYASDYVELFNSGSVAVNIGGWQLQYGSATGLFASGTFSIATLPAGATIAPCGYYLVACGSAATGPLPCPTPDFANAAGPNLSASSGKIALAPAGTALGFACAAMLPVAIDLFGWGTANCYEGTVAIAPSTAQVAVRNLGGMSDTDVNSTNFTNMAQPYATHTAASGYRNPECLVVPAIKGTWGQVKTLYR